MYYIENGQLYKTISNTDINGNEFFTAQYIGSGDTVEIQAKIDDLNAQLDAINKAIPKEDIVSSLKTMSEVATLKAVE